MANRFLNNITINDEYTLPAADGTTDQVLTTDGAGQLVFVDQDTIASGSAEVVEVPVKNVQGSGLTKGDPVYISGSVGASGRLEVQLADAGNSAKMPAVGLLKQDLANNGEGFAVVTGKLRNLVTSPIDGVTPSEGDVVYVKSGGSTGAALTTTKPTGASNLIQNMGKVGRVSTASDGTYVVSSILRSNDVPNLTTGKIWVGTANNTAESGVVFLDEANARMGINTTSPSEALYVIGNVRASGNFIGTNAYWSSTFGNKGTNQGIRFEAPSTSLQTARVDADAFAVNFGGTGGAGEVFRILEGGNVGIGTTSPSALLEIASTGTGDSLLITNDDATSSAAPVLTLKRDSATPADGDYLGQLKFKGENSTGGEIVYAKITAKISDVTAGTEDGLIETAIHSNSSNVIVSRQTGTDLKLINSVGLQVDGDTGLGNTSPTQKLHVTGNARVTGAYYDSSNSAGTSGQVLSSTGSATSWVDAATGTVTGTGTATQVAFWDGTSNLDGDANLYFDSTNKRLGIGTSSPTNPLTVVGSNSISVDDYIIHNGDTDTYFGFSSDGNVSFVNNAGNEMLVYDGGVRVYNTLRSNTEIQVDGTIIDNGGSTGTSGQILSSTGTGVSWISGGGGGATELNDLTDVEIGLGSAAFINIPSGGVGTGTLIIGSGAGNSMTSGATNNIAIGLNSGASITSSDEHTMIGSGAGRYVVPGTGGNTLVGYDTGLGVSGSSTYTYTTAVGVDCLKALTTGNRNTVVGSESGINITTGSSNIVMGNLSGNGLITRQYAVVIGYQAMQNADSGSTVAIGYQANNTASTTFGTGAVHIGYQAGRSSTRNRAVNIGYGAGYSATSGGGVVIGEFAGYSNTSASNRTIVGPQAARLNTANNATAMGAYALYSSGTGYGCTAVGTYALYANTSGSYNVAIGHDAGKAVTTGGNNTIIGADAGDQLQTGSNNTLIGRNASASSTSVSNEITLGNTSISSLRCNVTSITSLSDKRDKKNIEESNYGLNVIDKLKPVTFDWNTRDGSKTDIKDLGFIAQDLQGVDDEHLRLVYDENPEKLEATYGRLIPVLVKAIQELKAEIELLKS